MWFCRCVVHGDFHICQTALDQVVPRHVPADVVLKFRLGLWEVEIAVAHREIPIDCFKHATSFQFWDFDSLHRH